MSRGIAAVIVAGGSGERFGRAEGKQLAEVAGWPVLSWSVRALDRSGLDLLVIVCHPGRVEEYRAAAIEPLAPTTPVRFAAGGATRQESVSSGLAVIPDGFDTVVVHDGARPLVTAATVRRALDALAGAPEAQGVVIGHPSVDTLKVVECGRIIETPDRERVWSAQTPQVFRLDVLRRAHAVASREGWGGTDDSALVERIGGTVLMVEGPRDNIKVTVPEDFAFVETALRQRTEEG